MYIKFSTNNIISTLLLELNSLYKPKITLFYNTNSNITLIGKFQINFNLQDSLNYFTIIKVYISNFKPIAAEQN